MSFETAEFRRILGHLATGVAVVSAADPDGGPLHGLTANAVASVSLDPPLVLACVERTADTHECIERAGAFAISILGAGDDALARRFADYPSERKFAGAAHRPEVTGAPVLDEALAWVDCRVWAVYDGGDHTIFVGEVVAGDAMDGPPLLYFRGGYGRVAH
ncbi:MAG TPA: flavin reductase family protein [Longimicrobiales bacterium]|nr:flavin reductase family protein [Longimicrobiales bacterium]